MDIRELKNLLKNSTSVLMLDNGEPAYVILDYQVFKNLTQEKGEEVKVPVPEATVSQGNGLALSAQEMEALERLNKEIQALKEQIAAEEKEVFFPESESRG